MTLIILFILGYLLCGAGIFIYILFVAPIPKVGDIGNIQAGMETTTVWKRSVTKKEKAVAIFIAWFVSNFWPTIVLHGLYDYFVKRRPRS